MAKLYFRWGAMNCGKTTALLQVDYNYTENNKKSIIIKPDIDTKGESKAVSRIGVSKEVDIVLHENDDLIRMAFKFLDDNIDCIVVDEAQFLNSKQVKAFQMIAKITNIPVICYGLRTDFRGELFEGSKELLAIADEIEELVTICSCGKRAKANARMVNGSFVIEGNQVSIDGDHTEEKYVPKCATCYIRDVLIPNGACSIRELELYLRGIKVEREKALAKFYALRQEEIEITNIIKKQNAKIKNK